MGALRGSGLQPSWSPTGKTEEGLRPVRVSPTRNQTPSGRGRLQGEGLRVCV